MSHTEERSRIIVRSSLSPSPFVPSGSHISTETTAAPFPATIDREVSSFPILIVVQKKRFLGSHRPICDLIRLL
ncbi:hypothetical protein KXW00_007736, partial [Aspergillus fumigatus]